MFRLVLCDSNWKFRPLWLLLGGWGPMVSPLMVTMLAGTGDIRCSVWWLRLILRRFEPSFEICADRDTDIRCSILWLLLRRVGPNDKPSLWSMLAGTGAARCSISWLLLRKAGAQWWALLWWPWWQEQGTLDVPFGDSSWEGLGPNGEPSFWQEQGPEKGWDPMVSPLMVYMLAGTGTLDVPSGDSSWEGLGPYGEPSYGVHVGRNRGH